MSIKTIDLLGSQIYPVETSNDRFPQNISLREVERVEDPVK